MLDFLKYSGNHAPSSEVRGVKSADCIKNYANRLAARFEPISQNLRIFNPCPEHLIFHTLTAVMIEILLAAPGLNKK